MDKPQYIGIIVILLILTTATVTVILNLHTSGLRTNSPINSNNIKNLMQEQMDLGNRIPGSPGSLKFKDWILSKVSSPWTITIQSFNYSGVELRNYIILSETNNQSNTYPQILIGAHYDTRAKANQDPNPAKQNDPVPGANDGASGVAGILELMRVIPQNYINKVGFVLFDGEDQGDGAMPNWAWLVGSNYFVYLLSQTQIKEIKTFILFDMIANDQLVMTKEQFSTPYLNAEFWQVASNLGYGNIFINKAGPYLTDDHNGFLSVGISSIDLIDFSYPEWHTTMDDMNHISPVSAAIVVDVTNQWISENVSSTVSNSVPNNQIISNSQQNNSSQTPNNNLDFPFLFVMLSLIVIVNPVRYLRKFK